MTIITKAHSSQTPIFIPVAAVPFEEFWACLICGQFSNGKGLLAKKMRNCPGKH
jgi:hypothetical protein